MNIRTVGARTERRVATQRIMWIVVGLVAAGLLVVTVRGITMNALWLDFFSFWPVWVGVVFMWVMIRRRGALVRSGPIGFVPPVAAWAGMVALISLHLAGWSFLPSVAGNIQGPSAGGTSFVDLTIKVEGALRMDADQERLYQASLIRRGGTAGPPQVSNITQGERVSLAVTERQDAGWFRSAGWEVWLAPGPAWALEVESPDIEADLSQINLSALSLTGAGLVRLGSPIGGEVPIRTVGDLVVEVSAQATVEVVGPAQVGSGWEFTSDGRRFTGTVPGSYVIVAEEDTNLVVQQWDPKSTTR